MNPSITASIRAEALFVSDLQASEDPAPAQIRAVILRSLGQHRTAGCAALVAQEYGDHPSEAVERMRWAVAAVRTAYARPEHAGSTFLRRERRRSAGAARATVRLG
ncbi:hypothetical protein [Micromonospora fulviviridis]|uniref:hypothetical protein n=1 Tax=Micromonospora fulviviridis TaxID=47860 RepID=UPI0037944457